MMARVRRLDEELDGVRQHRHGEAHPHRRVARAAVEALQADARVVPRRVPAIARCGEDRPRAEDAFDGVLDGRASARGEKTPLARGQSAGARQDRRNAAPGSSGRSPRRRGLAPLSPR